MLENIEKKNTIISKSVKNSDLAEWMHLNHHILIKPDINPTKLSISSSYPLQVKYH